jgi:branched-chain amino acid transport system ATP-binding protein
MLQLVDIHTYYGESYVLQGISMDVTKGSIVGLLGRNGMGKTTTIRSIIGLTPPRRGRIYFNGEEITHLQVYQIARKGVALVPQGRQIFPSLTTEENLIVAGQGSREQTLRLLEEAYFRFPILKERANCKANLMSGGEQQMLAISRALMNKPDLLLMDEPSEGLAPLIVREIIRIIGELKDRGFSILLVEQNLPMALEVADYVFVIDRGLIVYESTPEKLEANTEVKDTYLGV